MHSSKSPVHQLHAISDAPIARATIETRTPEDQARDVGALIIRRLFRSGVCQHLPSPVASLLLLHRMCFEHGQVEEFSAGLIVRLRAQDIAAGVGMSPRSAYVPMRALEEAGVIRKLRPGGNRPDAFEVVMPPPGDDEIPPDRCTVERAPAMTHAAQIARATARASLDNDAEAGPNYLPEHELARARARASLDNDAGNNGDPCYLAENAAALLTARANSPIHDDHDDESSSCVNSDQPPPGPDDPAKVMAVLLACRIDQSQAQRWSLTTPLEKATAIKCMIERRRLNNPGGFAVARLKDGKIEDAALGEARRRLAPKPAPRVLPPPLAIDPRESAQRIRLALAAAASRKGADHA